MKEVPLKRLPWELNSFKLFIRFLLPTPSQQQLENEEGDNLSHGKQKNAFTSKAYLASGVIGGDDPASSSVVVTAASFLAFGKSLKERMNIKLLFGLH